MALIPKIEVAQSTCNKIKLVEKTNPYSSATNTSGWGNVNIDASEISTAVVNIYPYSDTSAPAAVSSSGTITGTLFTDTTHGSGNFAVGQILTGTGIIPGTQIVALGTGTGNNNGGTYIVNISQTVTATTINGYSVSNSIILKNTTINYYLPTVNYPTPSEFTILDNINWTNGDGIFKIEYQIISTENPAVTYNNKKQYVLFICNICKCKDKLILKLVESCSSENTKKLKEQVDQMELFIYGIQTAFACGDFDTVNMLITNSATYCQSILDCDCGCKGC
jgi:hypothetical protein